MASIMSPLWPCYTNPTQVGSSHGCHRTLDRQTNDRKHLVTLTSRVSTAFARSSKQQRRTQTPRAPSAHRR
jgi:hypothetical protein